MEGTPARLGCVAAQPTGQSAVWLVGSLGSVWNRESAGVKKIPRERRGEALWEELVFWAWGLSKKTKILLFV